MTVLLKIGGSLLYDENENLLIDRIKSYARIIIDYPDVRAVVCGGGLIARKFIDAGRELGSKEYLLDMMGINVSRLNAQLLITALGKEAYQYPIISINDAAKMNTFTDRILVAGGFEPGQSTTTVAMQFAEACDIDKILILTNVDGVYDKNPKNHADAKKFDRIALNELEEIVVKSGGDNQSSAGEYRIFDALSAQLFKRNDFQVKLMNGSKYDEIREILDLDFSDSDIGTLIKK